MMTYVISEETHDLYITMLSGRVDIVHYHAPYAIRNLKKLSVMDLTDIAKNPNHVRECIKQALWQLEQIQHLMLRERLSDKKRDTKNKIKE